MDFSTSSLFASLFVGCLGTGIFLYGKATSKLMPVMVGLAMGIYPFFITAVGPMLVIAGLMCGVLYYFREQA